MADKTIIRLIIYGIAPVGVNKVYLWPPPDLWHVMHIPAARTHSPVSADHFVL